MIKPSFFAAFTASVLFIAGLLVGPIAHAADDVTLPETLRVEGLMITGLPVAIEVQKTDFSLLTSLQFGSTPLILKGSKIVKTTSTLTPSPTPTSTPTPSLTPTNTPRPTIVSSPAPAVQGGLSADRLFDMANNHRKSIGLNELQKDERACAVAQSRAPEIAGEIAGGTMHAGIRARNLPYWNSENIITMGSEEGAFNWWINDQIHKEAIEGNYTYSCVACSGYACVQEFTNFQSK